MNDNSQMGEQSFVEINYPSKIHPSCEGIHWGVEGVVEKYWAGEDAVRAGTAQPYERITFHDNLLLRGGADVLWLGLIGGLSGTTATAGAFFNNGNASIGVSTSNTAAAASQTNLQGTAQYWKGMEATYPTHTTGTGSTANHNISFRAVYSTAMANFAWNEWAIGNSTNSTGANTQRVLNRKVQSLGTKSTAATWTFTVTLSLS